MNGRGRLEVTTPSLPTEDWSSVHLDNLGLTRINPLIKAITRQIIAKVIASLFIDKYEYKLKKVSPITISSKADKEKNTTDNIRWYLNT